MENGTKGVLGGIIVAILIIGIVCTTFYISYSKKYGQPLTVNTVRDATNPDKIMDSLISSPQQQNPQ